MKQYGNSSSNVIAGYLVVVYDFGLGVDDAGFNFNGCKLMFCFLIIPFN